MFALNKPNPIIACVEDDADIQMLLSVYISNAMGVYPVFLKDSTEAFDFLGITESKAAENADLIIMDYQIPGINGINAIKKIRESGSYTDTPIIMITASDDQKILEQAFEAGANDFIAKPIRKTELIARIKSQLRLGFEMDLRKEREKKLLELSGKLEEANKKLKEIAFLDGLTGIPNRRHFDIAFRSMGKQTIRNQTNLSIIMIDIDHFKLYNDTYGHLQGDECLKKVGMILKSNLLRPTDFVARYGGEEFIAALPETDLHGAEEVAKRIQAAFETERIPHDKGIGGIVTVSMGIASTDGSDGKVFIVEYADEALYTAKLSGRNTYRFWRLDN
ncbi:GGDEF domain-containing response regulator [Desulforegula conservatrix]|uniref:GGDEF domain-containing response regulator n=1 Tax=Desulforegula conservatrix TaxID=153026 RepID=UPI000407E677|nr:diguanylate cyclase [Desulforegula conservatrix]